ncbi:MAG: amino acid ABC transporter substrate-binding protein [Telmatospirillum sp.]|nr:amino acid ABC transporter substrate-binding protein [Telmatospirillum sp.]
MKVLSIVVLCLALSAGLSPARAIDLVIYPAPEQTDDVRFRDLIEILGESLEKTRADYGPYRLMPADAVMTEQRQLTSLEHRTGDLTVVWSSTSEEKERILRPIRIPLRKGMLGLRIALIRSDSQSRVDAIRSIEDLRGLHVGQGIGWGDIQIYQANGIPVQEAPYPSLFQMTERGRFDLFPRGINEIFDEYEANRTALPDLAIERGLLIAYDWPYYFFLNRADERLAKRIETGLWLMIEDGSFDRIFWKHHAAAIRKANLKARRVIRLNNPFLPAATPRSDRRLWLDIDHLP